MPSFCWGREALSHSIMASLKTKIPHRMRYRSHVTAHCGIPFNSSRSMMGVENYLMSLVTCRFGMQSVRWWLTTTSGWMRGLFPSPNVCASGARGQGTLASEVALQDRGVWPANREPWTGHRWGQTWRRVRVSQLPELPHASADNIRIDFHAPLRFSCTTSILMHHEPDGPRDRC